jgi:hypothetical protein
LESIWCDLELGRDVRTEDSSLESLDVTSDVCFGREEMAFVGVEMRFLVSVRHDDLSLVCLDLRKRKKEVHEH